LLNWRHALSEEINAKFLELGTRKSARVILTISESLTFDFRLMSSWENTLGLFTLGTKTTESTCVAANVDTSLLLEVLKAVVDDSVIEIFTTQVSVTIGGLNFEDTVFNGKEWNIKSTTTKIENENVALTFSLLVKTVSDSSGGGFVDNTLDVETRDGTSILGGLSLWVIEISGDSDDGVLNGLSEVSFSDFLHLEENHWWDFFSLELLDFSLELDDNKGFFARAWLNLEGPQFNVTLHSLVRELATNEALGVEDSVGGVSCGLIFGSISDEALLFSEGNIGWGSVETLIISDDFNFIVLPDTYAWVGGSEIDTDGWVWHKFRVLVLID